MTSDKRLRSAVLVVATLTAFMMPFMASAVNLALPAIQREFSLSAAMVNGIVSIYLLSAAVALVPSGRLADLYGRKLLFTAGVVLFSASSLVLGFSNGIVWLLAGRVAQGLGGGMMMATGLAIISSVFPAGERGRAIGFNVAAVYVGLAVGPYAGGLLTEALGWRSIFLCNFPLGVLTVVLLVLKVPGEWADGGKGRFDGLGAVLYAFSLVSFMAGLSLLPALSGLLLVLFGAGGFVLFTCHELRAPFPLFEVRLFRDNRVFAFSSLAALINYGSTFAVSFLLSLYLQHVRGLGPGTAGAVLLWQPVVMALLSPVAGRLSDRAQPRLIASLGMGMSSLGLLLLTFLGRDGAILYVILCLVCLGIGFALFSSPNMNAIMGSVAPHHYGIASGAVGAMRLIGQMCSMAIALVVFALVLGSHGEQGGNHPALPQALTICFGIFSILCGVGIVFSLARGNLRREWQPAKENHEH